jgi:hypothetical protein
VIFSLAVLVGYLCFGNSAGSKKNIEKLVEKRNLKIQNKGGYLKLLKKLFYQFFEILYLF